jgi:hypothetical protein
MKVYVIHNQIYDVDLAIIIHNGQVEGDLHELLGSDEVPKDDDDFRKTVNDLKDTIGFRKIESHPIRRRTDFIVALTIHYGLMERDKKSSLIYNFSRYGTELAGMILGKNGRTLAGYRTTGCPVELSCLVGWCVDQIANTYAEYKSEVLMKNILENSKS